MLRDDPVCDGQSESGPLVFGREVGIEDPVQVLHQNPDTRVPDLDNALRFILLRMDLDMPSRRDRVQRVEHQIQQHLFHLLSVQWDRPSRVERWEQLDLLRVHLRGHGRQHLSDDRVRRGGHKMELRRPRERQELVYDLVHTLHLGPHRPDHPPVFLLILRRLKLLLQSLDQHPDRVERIPDLVCDPRGQLPHSGEPLGPAQVLLHPAYLPQDPVMFPVQQRVVLLYDQKAQHEESHCDEDHGHQRHMRPGPGRDLLKVVRGQADPEETVGDLVEHKRLNHLEHLPVLVPGHP